MTYRRLLSKLDCTGCLAPYCKELAIIEVDPSELNEYMQVEDELEEPDCYN